MRALLFGLFCLPGGAWADIIPVAAPLTAVTIYAQGAVVTREANVTLPAGDHTVRLGDMDPSLDQTAIDVELSDAVITSRSWRPNGSGPYRAPRTPEWMTAKSALDAAQEALDRQNDAIALAAAKGQAAQDQIKFLNGVSLPDDAATDIDTLRAIGQLIASDGTAARAAITAAEVEARDLRKALPDLNFAVAQAQAALDAVTPANTEPAALDLNVNVPAATEASLTVRYVTQSAQWAPVYTMTLLDDTALRIERGATIAQYSGEDWKDVALTLSTLSPFRGSEPGTLWPLLRRIHDETIRPLGLTASRSTVFEADAAAPALLEEPTLESVATADFSGVGVSYSLPGRVSVPTRQEALRIALDTIDVEAALSARAVPRLNDTAFRQVSFANTTSEILLPGEAVLYVDTQLVGTTRMTTLPPNADHDIFFGPIEGLRLKRTVLDRNEGDRGIISRSNEEREDISLEIENLTAKTWSVDVRESVPYSEQEDLVINWDASPAPDIDGVDDRRGILEWSFSLAPGETQQISMETIMTWPEGQVLR